MNTHYMKSKSPEEEDGGQSQATCPRYTHSNPPIALLRNIPRPWSDRKGRKINNDFLHFSVHAIAARIVGADAAGAA